MVNYKGHIDEQSMTISVGNMNLSQLLPWIMGLSQLADPNKYDKVYMAYVMNDDAISFLDDIKNIWNSIIPVSKYGLPNIEFPLMKNNKSHIWHSLFTYLLDLVVWCEYGNDRHDCNCPSCKRARFNNIIKPKHEIIINSIVDPVCKDVTIIKPIVEIIEA